MVTESEDRRLVIILALVRICVFPKTPNVCRYAKRRNTTCVDQSQVLTLYLCTRVTARDCSGFHHSITNPSSPFLCSLRARRLFGESVANIHLMPQILEAPVTQLPESFPRWCYGLPLRGMYFGPAICARSISSSGVTHCSLRRIMRLPRQRTLYEPFRYLGL